jgi:hypothetical protein
VNGVELSPGSRSLAPGQRAFFFVPPMPAMSTIGAVGLVNPNGRPGVKALKVVSMRAMPPFASWIPEVPKSLNQETSSGV